MSAIKTEDAANGKSTVNGGSVYEEGGVTVLRCVSFHLKRIKNMYITNGSFVLNEVC